MVLYLHVLAECLQFHMTKQVGKTPYESSNQPRVSSPPPFVEYQAVPNDAVPGAKNSLV